MGKKMQQIIFFYHIILLIFIRKSVLVELVSQGWEAPDQINLDDLKHLKLPIHASGPSLKVLALVIMMNSAQFLECYLLQTVVFNYCLLNIFAYTQSISLFHNVVYVLFLSKCI